MNARVLLVEDHELMRYGTRQVLKSAGWQVVGETGDGTEAVVMAQKLHPDLMLLDLVLRGMHGLTVLKEVKRLAPAVKVMVVTGHNVAHLAQAAWEAGADGYALKDLPWEAFEQGMRAVLAGRRWAQASVQEHLRTSGRPSSEALTRRECEILNAIADGLPNSQIASRLNIREGTVEYHVGNILGKLGADNRTEAVKVARERGFLG